MKFLKRLIEIYHLACIASPTSLQKYSIETLNTNFIGTTNVLKLALRTLVPKFYLHPVQKFMAILQFIHKNESYYGNVNTIGERSCYDEGKRVGETLMYEYRKKYGIDTKVIRIFNTYGPFMDLKDGRVITNFIQKIIENGH